MGSRYNPAQPTWPQTCWNLFIMKLISAAFLGFASVALAAPAKQQTLKMPRNLSESKRLANTARKTLRQYGFNVKPSMQNKAVALFNQEKARLEDAAVTGLDSVISSLEQLFTNNQEAISQNVDLAASQLANAKATAQAKALEHNLNTANLKSLKSQGAALVDSKINQNLENLEVQKFVNSLLDSLKNSVNENTAAFDQWDLSTVREIIEQNLASKRDEILTSARAKFVATKNEAMRQISVANSKCAEFMQSGSKCQNIAREAIAKLQGLTDMVPVEEVTNFANEQIAKIAAVQQA